MENSKFITHSVFQNNQERQTKNENFYVTIVLNKNDFFIIYFVIIKKRITAEIWYSCQVTSIIW